MTRKTRKNKTRKNKTRKNRIIGGRFCRPGKLKRFLADDEIDMLRAYGRSYNKEICVRKGEWSNIIKLTSKYRENAKANKATGMKKARENANAKEIANAMKKANAMRKAQENANATKKAKEKANAMRKAQDNVRRLQYEQLSNLELANENTEPDN